MAETGAAMMAGVPTGTGIASGFARVGIPLAAGFGGLIVGDIFGAYGVIGQAFDQISLVPESQLPVSNLIDYKSLATEIPYGIALGVTFVLARIVPGDGKWWHVAVFRSVKWFLIGIMIHVGLSAFQPLRVGPSTALTLPTVGR